MNISVGRTDQLLRFVLGLGLVIFTLTHLVGDWGWIGLILISTSMLRICPLYSLLSINTCSYKDEPK